MIDSSIYLQVDATALAGIFILLTIGSAIKSEKMHERMIQKIGKYQIYFTLYSAVLVLCAPFALSAIFIIADDGLYPKFISWENFHTTFISIYIALTAVGFAYIMWVIAAMAQHHDRIP